MDLIISSISIGSVSIHPISAIFFMSSHLISVSAKLLWPPNLGLHLIITLVHLKLSHLEVFEIISDHHDYYSHLIIHLISIF